MAGVALLALGRPVGARLVDAGSSTEFGSGSGKCGAAPGAGIGDCDFHDVKAMPEE